MVAGSEGVIVGETSTWSELFARRITSTAPAVVSADATWSGMELAARAAGAADWLDQIGLPATGPVPALVTTRADSFALTLGALGSGRHLAPLGPRLTERELVACLAGLAAPVLVAEAEVADHALAVGRAAGMRVEILPAFAPSSRPLDLDHAVDDIAAIIHTSGTSGLPKPVAYRQHRMALRTRANAGLIMLGPGSLYASASPFHHIAGLGLLFVALGAGAALVPLPRFTVEAWSEIVELGVTHAVLVPTMVEALLEEGRLLPGRLRLLHYGASPISPSTLRRMLHALPGVALAQIYGQTEGSPITCLTAADHELAAAGRDELLASAGRAAPGVELVIAEPDTRGLGEVWARADHFFQPDVDGWLRTGDLGRLDDEGYLFLNGRKGDMIIRGGENVYPAEVEGVIGGHPEVAEVAVVGAPDVRLGQLVRAYVVAVDPGAPPDSEVLRRHARQGLAGYKVPAEWVFIDALPRNAAGKVLRRELST